MFHTNTMSTLQNIKDKISNIFENFFWKKSQNVWNIFLIQLFFFHDKHILIGISRTFYFEYSFISKTNFCDIWRLEIWDSVNIHDLLIVFRTFLLEFSTDFICMRYLNVTWRVIHEYIMEIWSVENSRRKVRKIINNLSPNC